MPAFVIALLGAESTGKTELSLALREALAAEGPRVALVPEALRKFDELHGRTPRCDEQREIADEQSLRIAEAALDHDIVVADTTALMTAVYSEQVFGDPSMYDAALEQQGRVALTLLMALDLPWQPDGLHRDGPQSREPVDTLLRAALAREGLPYSVVSGHGGARLHAALACVRRAMAPPPTATRWHWVCERCGDNPCERHRLPRG